MPKLPILDRKREHIYDEMWAYLRRNSKTNTRANEQDWLQNLEYIYALRQQLIDHDSWGLSRQDQRFDRYLKLSIASELRLALRLRKKYSQKFTLRLLKELRRFILDPETQQRLANIGIYSEEIEDYLLGHIVRIDAQNNTLPDSIIVDLTQNMLHSHYIYH